jgi:hypothetical protein
MRSIRLEMTINEKNKKNGNGQKAKEEKEEQHVPRRKG